MTEFSRDIVKREFLLGSILTCRSFFTNLPTSVVLVPIALSFFDVTSEVIGSKKLAINPDLDKPA